MSVSLWLCYILYEQTITLYLKARTLSSAPT
jgi:hypothetical protein